MGNTLTALAPELFSAAQEVSAEPFGIIGAINANFDDKGVAIGDKVGVPVAPTRTNGAYTPSMNPNNGNAGTDAIAAVVDVEITKSQFNSFHLTGEQERSLQNSGTDKEWFRQIVAQGMRALRNEAEADAYAAVKAGASRAVGVAGTTPFATSLDEIVDIKTLLRNNGMPFTDAQLVLDPAAANKLQKLGVFNLAYAAGSDAERRSGVLGKQYGFSLRDSAQITQHVKGTATGFDVDLAAGYNPKDTVIHVDGGNGGTLKAGDIITFAGASHKYVASAAIAALVEDDIYINRPGLLATLADTVEGTIGDSYTPCLAFERNAIVGIMRPPIIPASPLIEQMLISDSMGMTYLLCRVIGDGMVTWRLHLAWGFKAVQPEHIGLILG